MDLQRITIKIMADTADSFDVIESVPVYHNWIRDERVGDLLLDVADYAHVPDGPGIMLIADEGHYGLDLNGGKLGMRYARKRHLTGTLEERILKTLFTTLTACNELAKDLPGRIFFPCKILEVTFDDRLLVPNSSEGAAKVADALNSVLAEVFGADGLTVTQAENDSRQGLTFTVTVEKEQSVDQLVSKLSATVTS